MSTQLSAEMIQATTDFHGHWCPGLAIGIRAAEWALKEMGKARILASLMCDICGEAVMESRTRRFQGQTLCIPCFEDLARRL